MLRKPYTIDKLLGLVKSVLPTTGLARVENAAPPNWQKQTASIGLRM
jgi:hypothetical protein